MSRTPLPPCPLKSTPLWCIFFALPAMNDPLTAELKFRENTRFSVECGIFSDFSSLSLNLSSSLSLSPCAILSSTSISSSSSSLSLGLSMILSS